MPTIRQRRHLLAAIRKGTLPNEALALLSEGRVGPLIEMVENPRNAGVVLASQKPLSTKNAHRQVKAPADWLVGIAQRLVGLYPSKRSSQFTEMLGENMLRRLAAGIESVAFRTSVARDDVLPAALRVFLMHVVAVLDRLEANPDGEILTRNDTSYGTKEFGAEELDGSDALPALFSQRRPMRSLGAEAVGWPVMELACDIGAGRRRKPRGTRGQLTHELDDGWLEIDFHKRLLFEGIQVPWDAVLVVQRDADGQEVKTPYKDWCRRIGADTKCWFCGKNVLDVSVCTRRSFARAMRRSTHAACRHEPTIRSWGCYYYWNWCEVTPKTLLWFGSKRELLEHVGKYLCFSMAPWSAELERHQRQVETVTKAVGRGNLAFETGRHRLNQIVGSYERIVEWWGPVRDLLQGQSEFARRIRSGVVYGDSGFETALRRRVPAVSASRLGDVLEGLADELSVP